MLIINAREECPTANFPQARARARTPARLHVNYLHTVLTESDGQRWKLRCALLRVILKRHVSSMRERHTALFHPPNNV